MKKEKQDASLIRLRKRHARLASALGETGLILQGTITERTMVRPLRSDPARKKRYGPYYQWTRKREGKTVTVNLTAAQARAYHKAIDNHRRLEKLVRDVRAVSLEILEATTPSVHKRKAPCRPPKP